MAIENIWVIAYDGLIGGWTLVGTPPYLDVQDEPINYVYSISRNLNDGYYTFQTTTKTGTIISVTLYIYAYGGASNDFTTLLDLIDTGLGPPASWGWVNVDVTAILDTWAKINAVSMYFDRRNTTNNAGVDAAYLSIDYTPPTTGFKQLQYFSEPAVPGWNSLKFAAEPPVTGAWNKLLYAGEP